MLSTCSRPPAELLKIRTCPAATTYRPVQGSLSPNTNCPAENLRGTARCETNANSSSARLEKIGTFARTLPGVESDSSTANIVAEHDVNLDPTILIRRCPTFARFCANVGTRGISIHYSGSVGSLNSTVNLMLPCPYCGKF